LRHLSKTAIQLYQSNSIIMKGEDHLIFFNVHELSWHMGSSCRTTKLCPYRPWRTVYRLDLLTAAFLQFNGLLFLTTKCYLLQVRGFIIRTLFSVPFILFPLLPASASCCFCELAFSGDANVVTLPSSGSATCEAAGAARSAVTGAE